MDWKIFLTTMFTIFIAELGDKTQFAAMASAAAHPKNSFAVLLGVIVGLVLAGCLGVLAGQLLTPYIKPTTLKTASGLFFIVIGFVFIFGR